MNASRGVGALNLTSERLDNGLVVAGVRLPSLHRAVIAARVRVGSAYETAQENGISHFLEHMLFRGTPTHPTAHRLAAAFEELGGTLEASTSEEHGTLSISVPTESLGATLGLFCEVLRDPLLEELEVERDIVREELLETLDDEEQDIDASSRCRRLCFGDHPLGYPIGGTLPALDNIDRAALERHHACHYTGENLALVVSGPIDVDATLKATRRELQGLPAGSRPKGTALDEPSEPRFEFFRHKASQTSLSVCYRAFEQQSRLEPATEMLMRVLDDGLSTRLYHRLCDQLGLCYDASADYQAFATGGVVEFAMDTAHDRAATLLREVLGLGLDLATSGPTEQEMERARRRCRWQFDALVDDPESVAHYYAHLELSGVRLSPEQRCEQLCDVSRTALLEAAQAIFRPERLCVAAVGLQRPKAREMLEALTLTGH